eukprot:1583917-Prorocentrum_lima.AAC.1
MDMPWLIGGDWNMEPDVLTGSGWLDRLQASILHTDVLPVVMLVMITLWVGTLWDTWLRTP